VNVIDVKEGEINGVEKRPIGKLSGGQQQKVLLAWI
jgi:ABC-type Mn2+/Zn2+ transport system ATPase subunit